MATKDNSPQVAVWYFVAATLIFASTELIFANPAPWLRGIILIIGFGLVVAGGVQLGKELNTRRRNDRP